MKTKIGFVDSGIGGLSVLKETLKLLPSEEYVYLHDGINNPYGEKSTSEILAIMEQNVDTLRKLGCNLIVVACNTATTSCIKKLRDKYLDIDFVGSEPAIKKAIDEGYQKILVVATTLTVNSEKVKDNIKLWKNGSQKVNLLGSKYLAKAIELRDEHLIDSEVEMIKEEVLRTNSDALVLGCTHYCLIKERFNMDGVDVIDGNLAIARQVSRIYQSKYESNDKLVLEYIVSNSETKIEWLDEIVRGGYSVRS